MLKRTSNDFSIPKTPMVAYFGADWCSSCPAVKHAINAIEEYFPVAQFFEINVTEDALVAESLNVSSLPTVVFFDDGKEQTRFTGSTAGKYIKTFLVDHFNVG